MAVIHQLKHDNKCRWWWLGLNMMTTIMMMTINVATIHLFCVSSMSRYHTDINECTQTTVSSLFMQICKLARELNYWSIWSVLRLISTKPKYKLSFCELLNGKTLICDQNVVKIQVKPGNDTFSLVGNQSEIEFIVLLSVYWVTHLKCLSISICFFFSSFV